MNLVLKGFSQEVDVARPDRVNYFMVFKRDSDGKEIKLPVQQETTTHLIAALYEVHPSEVQEQRENTEAEDSEPLDEEIPEPLEEDELEGADVFGGDEDGVESI